MSRENVSYSHNVEILRLRKARARLEMDLLAHPDNKKISEKLKHINEEITWYQQQLEQGWGHKPKWYG